MRAGWAVCVARVVCPASSSSQPVPGAAVLQWQYTPSPGAGHQLQHSSPRTLHPPQTPGPGASHTTSSDHTSTSDSVTRPAAALGPGQGRRGAE